MKFLLITGDVAAMGGILSSVAHLVPETAGTIAALLGAAWYGVMLFDRLIKKRDDYDTHK